jgi:low temperature requirement protein LtrA
VSPTKPRLSAALRQDGRVSPLELFFDLVFVLALTQCTALMASVPTVQGVGQALLVLSALWWSWIGYAWLTSVVDPESGLVRAVIFVAMAAFLIAALCVPGAFGGAALTFALAFATVRTTHIVLFVLASRDDPALRTSVLGLAGSTAVSGGLLLAAAATDDTAQALLWVVALVVDLGGPYLFGAEGWRMVPDHFAERHGLILLIALGESVVAIGTSVIPGRAGGIAGDVVLTAIVAIGLVGALWWLYFDVTALVAARRLANSAPGRERNEIGRDSYSYLHLPMVAGILLVALGLKQTFHDVGGTLDRVPATALLGGAALYLLALVAFRLRNVHRLSTPRLVAAILLLALIPVGPHVPAIAAVAGVTVLLLIVVGYETVRFAPLRAQLLASHTDRADA